MFEQPTQTITESATAYINMALIRSGVLKDRLRAGTLTPAQQHEAMADVMADAEFVHAITGLFVEMER